MNTLPMKELEAKAAELGAEAGTAAGTWVEFDPATAASTLQMIDDGDPEVLDLLPSAPLSYEFADGWCLPRLAEELGVPADCEELDDLATAFEVAWEDAMVEEVVRRLLYQLD